MGNHTCREQETAKYLIAALLAGTKFPENGAIEPELLNRRGRLR